MTQITAEGTAEVEQFMAQAAAQMDDDGDVHGFLVQLFIGGALAIFGVALGAGVAQGETKGGAAKGQEIQKAFVEKYG